MPEQKRPGIRLLFLITTPKLAEKAERMFKEGNVRIQMEFYGHGTASSEMMDAMGLSDEEKSALLCFLPKGFADELLKKLRKDLRLGLANNGVAFTVPISGASGRTAKLIESEENEEEEKTMERTESDMKDREYSLIMAIVDRGYSEDVMDVARPKGATGGTVFNSRRVGSEEAMKFWGITIQPEREIVMILSDNSGKHDIMQAISEHCGMNSEAHGMIISLPVDAVVGLE